MVRDKVEICNSFLSSFTAFQGVGKFALYNKAKYAALAEIIEQEADTQYKHFFAQPVEDGDKITWYATPFDENPSRLSELSDNDSLHYTEIKNKTLNHYHELIKKLNSKGDLERLEYIEKALKSVSDEFVYCYDNKVVLTAWGMKPKPNIHTSTGEYIIDIFAAKKEKPKVTITFDAGSNGRINGERYHEVILEKDSFLPEEIIPTIELIDGYEFESWSANDVINGASPMTEDVVITANYKKIIKTVSPSEEPIQPAPQPLKTYTVTFGSYLDGKKQEEVKSEFEEGHSISADEIPFNDNHKKHKFTGWDNDPKDFQVKSNIHFRADYESKLPWWKKLWNWLTSKGCLTWLLRTLLIALLIALILYLWKSCDHENNGVASNNKDGIKRESPISDREQYNNPDNWLIDENKPEQQSGVYIKDPNTQLPTNPRIIIPFEEDEIIRSDDNLRSIVAGRLNGMIDKKKSLIDFAKKFKSDFPSADYEIIYFDTLLNRVQFYFPESQRANFKAKLNQQYTEFDLFVWDETLFETYQIKDPDYTNPKKRWHLDAIKAEAAWKITMGDKNVIVAVVDNGFDLNHVEFQNKIVRPYNVLKRSYVITKSADNHGTHVAGIAIANTNDKGLLGVAPKCSFMPVQISDERNLVAISAVLDGILYAIYQGADVINVSIGLSFAENPEPISIREQQELINNNFKEEERLWKKVFQLAEERNTIIVVAAGNDNMLAGIDPLQRHPNVITVSAVNKSNRGVYKSEFSNFGTYTTISAPGVQIYSTLNNNNYGVQDGTSMAAPIVTGAVALLKSQDKNISVSEVKKAIQNSGLKVDNKIGPLLQLDKLFNAAISSSQENSLINSCCPECKAIEQQIDSLKKELKKKKENCN